MPYGTLETHIRAAVAVDLMTVLAVDMEHRRLMRMHTSMPAQYATGETWPLMPSHWQEQVFDWGERLYCSNPEQVLQGFRDGSDILALGYQSAVAFPIASPLATGPSTVGVVNLLFKRCLVETGAPPFAWCDAVSAQIEQFVSILPSPLDA